jgi:hypothetical protein
MVGLEGSQLRVGDETRGFEEGKIAIFDDSFNHEAWHNGPTTRITLIMDIWHPDLSDEEVKFLKLLTHARTRGERKATAQEDDTFYSIIEKAKDIHKDQSWWVTSEEENRYIEGIFKGNEEEAKA